MKVSLYITLLSTAALVSAQNYCTKDYYSPSICKKFTLNKNQDNGRNAWDVKSYNTKNTQEGFSNVNAYNMALQMTNIFENNSPYTDYMNCQNIGDGRGWTCGSYGFTTDDGSAFTPIQNYMKLLKGKQNPFSKFTSKLSHLAVTGSVGSGGGGSTGGVLSSFGKIWAETACNDPLFRQAQDQAVFGTIDTETLRHAAYCNVKTNLGLAVLRDTQEEHGDGGGEPMLGMEAIIDHTYKRVGKHVDEKTFIKEFLVTRRQLLCCASSTWRDSADRVSDLQTVVASGNWDLSKSVTLPAYGFTLKVGEPLTKLPKNCKAGSSKMTSGTPSIQSGGSSHKSTHHHSKAHKSHKHHSHSAHKHHARHKKEKKCDKKQ